MRRKVFLFILKIGFAVLVLSIIVFVVLALMHSDSPMSSYGPTMLGSPPPENGVGTENQPNSDLESLINNELSKFRNGKILYNVPQDMKVGQSVRIEVRIEKSDTDAFTKDLQASGKLEIYGIKVAPLMKVTLVDNDNKFQIVNISDAEQIVINNSYTQWVWNVTPLKSGQANLSLVASFKLNIPNQVDRYQNCTLFEKKINVKVNPLFSMSKFISIYWQWIFGTILIPIAVFVVKRFFKHNKNEQKEEQKSEDSVNRKEESK